MCGIIPSSTYIMKVQVTSLIPQPPAPFKLSPIHIFYMIIEDENTVLPTMSSVQVVLFSSCTSLNIKF